MGRGPRGRVQLRELLELLDGVATITVSLSETQKSAKGRTHFVAESIKFCRA